MHTAAGLASSSLDWLCSAMARPHLTLLGQTKIAPLPLKDIISGTVGSFWSGGAFSGLRAMSIESSLVSGCGQGHESPEFASKKLWHLVQTQSRSRNTVQVRWLQRS